MSLSYSYFPRIPQKTNKVRGFSLSNVSDEEAIEEWYHIIRREMTRTKIIFNESQQK